MRHGFFIEGFLIKAKLLAQAGEKSYRYAHVMFVCMFIWSRDLLARNLTPRDDFGYYTTFH